MASSFSVSMLGSPFFGVTHTAKPGLASVGIIKPLIGKLSIDTYVTLSCGAAHGVLTGQAIKNESLDSHEMLIAAHRTSTKGPVKGLAENLSTLGGTPGID